MYKLVIFDLDGVLYDSKEIHFQALNIALEKVDKKLVISFDEHTNIYDGLTTKTKLDLLTQKKGLNKSDHKKIWKYKQDETQNLLNQIKPNKRLISILKELKSKKLFN